MIGQSVFARTEALVKSIFKSLDRGLEQMDLSLIIYLTIMEKYQMKTDQDKIFQVMVTHRISAIFGDSLLIITLQKESEQ